MRLSTTIETNERTSSAYKTLRLKKLHKKPSSIALIQRTWESNDKVFGNINASTNMTQLWNFADSNNSPVFLTIVTHRASEKKAKISLRPSPFYVYRYCVVCNIEILKAIYFASCYKLSLPNYAIYSKSWK